MSEVEMNKKIESLSYTALKEAEKVCKAFEEGTPYEVKAVFNKARDWDIEITFNPDYNLFDSQICDKKHHLRKLAQSRAQALDPENLEKITADLKRDRELFNPLISINTATDGKVMLTNHRFDSAYDINLECEEDERIICPAFELDVSHLQGQELKDCIEELAEETNKPAEYTPAPLKIADIAFTMRKRMERDQRTGKVSPREEYVEHVVINYQKARTVAGRIVNMAMDTKKRASTHSHNQMTEYWNKFHDPKDKNYLKPEWQAPHDAPNKTRWMCLAFPSNAEQQAMLHSVHHWLKNVSTGPPHQTIIAWNTNVKGAETVKTQEKARNKALKDLENLFNNCISRNRAMPMYSHVLIAPQFDDDEPLCYKWVQDNPASEGSFIKMEMLEK